MALKISPTTKKGKRTIFSKLIEDTKKRNKAIEDASKDTKKKGKK